jgi:enolase
MVAGGFSIGKHEAQSVFDGGTRWDGRGVTKAVTHVNAIIGPALNGLDATDQERVDGEMVKLDGTPQKSKLGGNAIASVSAAVLKAGAASLGIPLYRHIGGVNACTLPVPGIICIDGSARYGGGERAGGKPSYSFISFGFKSFSEASYACWETLKELRRVLTEHAVKLQTYPYRIAPATVKHDEELWDAMTTAIDNLGHKNRVGLQVDVAATTYYDENKDVFTGLFSATDKTREDLIQLYKDMVDSYPFLIIEDPLGEDDFEGHAILTRELGIEIIGDDLFATSAVRLQKGIESGACNAMLLKPPQVSTVSEAFRAVRLAYMNGYSVMPCGSRGEGPDIADYAVGLNTGQIREGGLGPTANRLLAIEAELDGKANFAGKAAFTAG